MVHFIFIDRSFGEMITPTIPVGSSLVRTSLSELYTYVCHKLVCVGDARIHHYWSNMYSVRGIHVLCVIGGLLVGCFKL